MALIDDIKKIGAECAKDSAVDADFESFDKLVAESGLTRSQCACALKTLESQGAVESVMAKVDGKVQKLYRKKEEEEKKKV